MTFDVQVRVWLKPSVFDPQGDAAQNALHSLGYTGVSGVRVGKYMELTVDAATEAQANEQVHTVCAEVLCNPVMETYAFTLAARATV
jgi:phosphoribosylformylglycinamidine synthase subunit PurS